MEKKKLIITPKVKKGDDGYKVFSVRLKNETVSRLEEICQKSGYSRNELIGELLSYALDNCEIKEP